MHRFYTTKENIVGDEIRITGADVNHIKNVLRMKVGEEAVICDGQGKDFYCIIEKMSSDEVVLTVKDTKETETELPAKIYLFQGLPKKDKMELIVQKAVELGVCEIIPVMMKRTIVKLEDKKKEAKKVERWQSIAEGAAKQSRRGIIPVVREAFSYKEAIAYAKELEVNMLPYELAEGMQVTKDLIHGLHGKKSIGIFIGPEGGFEEDEVKMAFENGITPITLGKRILRTETAGLAILSMIMLELEQ